MHNLKTIINNLKQKEEVDAVFVTGSQGILEQKSYSDIDLVVIFKENKQQLFSVFQIIDNKPADIFFFDVEQLKKMENDPEISANTMDAILVDWLDKSSIEFDKSGTITTMKNNLSSLRRKIQISNAEIKKFESIINAGYITNKRYFESNNPEYLEALEIKLLYDMNNILMGYFNFKKIPWRGEKNVLRYLKTYNKEFYDKYMSCIRSSSISDKFRLYSELVLTVLSYSESGLWDRSIISPSVKGVLDGNDKKRLVKYWTSLIE